MTKLHDAVTDMTRVELRLFDEDCSNLLVRGHFFAYCQRAMTPPMLLNQDIVKVRPPRVERRPLSNAQTSAS